MSNIKTIKTRYSKATLPDMDTYHVFTFTGCINKKYDNAIEVTKGKTKTKFKLNTKIYKGTEELEVGSCYVFEAIINTFESREDFEIKTVPYLLAVVPITADEVLDIFQNNNFSFDVKRVYSTEMKGLYILEGNRIINQKLSEHTSKRIDMEKYIVRYYTPDLKMPDPGVYWTSFILERSAKTILSNGDIYYQWKEKEENIDGSTNIHKYQEYVNCLSVNSLVKVEA